MFGKELGIGTREIRELGIRQTEAAKAKRESGVAGMQGIEIASPFKCDELILHSVL
jgi:hypothetical protein